MANLVINGPSPSTFVRTARLAAAEKGVPYTLEPVDFGADSHAAVHPFRKVPAIRHGDFALYETEAICRYIDAAFSGPPLQPAEPRARAMQDQWISALCDYCYKSMILDLALDRFLAKLRGTQPDAAKNAAAWPKVEHQLGLIEKAAAERPYLAGDKPSLADWFLLPMMFYLRMQPEFAAAAPRHKAVAAWYDRVAARPSFAATLPEMPKAA
jgi:glutathione S-transferase